LRIAPAELAYRGSSFRGVSVNGRKFQIFIFINKKKYYVGQALTNQEAARINDAFAIIHQGMHAETNFDYNREETENMIAPFLSFL
jgi:hypothetical protein